MTRVAIWTLVLLVGVLSPAMAQVIYEAPLEFQVEIRPRRKHAVIVCRRGPYLSKAAFGHQAFVAHSVPEGAADSAGIGSPIEYSAHHLYFAGPVITVFAYIAVEAQRMVVPSLAQVVLLQKSEREESLRVRCRGCQAQAYGF